MASPILSGTRRRNISSTFDPNFATSSHVVVYCATICNESKRQSSLVLSDGEILFFSKKFESFVQTLTREAKPKRILT